MDLGDRAKAVEQLGVNRLAHAAIVGVLKDALPATQAGLLVGLRHRPVARLSGTRRRWLAG
ncbi:hypothetical protein [Streptomyces sp. Ag109_G2-6]|uniref:hypothetical protein n=1 Tax=Streptomyces sp. Ag109_G2-6 TaxID=2485154 RepID=UPI000F4DB342|nr:hypothetical protein [Streptomyces sp. Ag109_G2-6]